MIRERGYTIYDGEQELGVRCVAAPVSDAPVRAAISVSGPDSRVTLERVDQIAPALIRVRESPVRDLTSHGS